MPKIVNQCLDTSVPVPPCAHFDQIASFFHATPCHWLRQRCSVLIGLTKLCLHDVPCSQHKKCSSAPGFLVFNRFAELLHLLLCHHCHRPDFSPQVSLLDVARTLHLPSPECRGVFVFCILSVFCLHSLLDLGTSCKHNVFHLLNLVAKRH